MKSKITTIEVREHQNKIKNLAEARYQARDQRDKEVSHLKWHIYREKLNAIEQERDEAIDKITQEYTTIIANIDSQIEEQASIVNQVKRILEFLKLDTSRDLAIPDDDIKLSNYVEPYQEALGYLYDDDFLKIKAFIIGNKKPKNKYSLVVIGKSMFPQTIIKYPYSYRIDISNWGRYIFLLQVIKDGDSVPDLKALYNRRKVLLLREAITEYEEVKVEYAEVKQTYTIADFSELKTWQCPKCANFYTVFDDFSISYLPQCYLHDIYIDMVKMS